MLPQMCGMPSTNSALLLAATTLLALLLPLQSEAKESVALRQLAQVDFCSAQTQLIGEVQGTGAKTPRENQSVHVRGVVTGEFQKTGGQGLGGFTIQDEGDGQPATSDGIFVFHNRVDVQLGDLVDVVGKAVEYFGQTQISEATVRICQRGQPLPAATLLPAQLPLPRDAAAQLERYEGMLVTPAQPLTVVDVYSLGRYGEVELAAGRPKSPTQVLQPGAAALAAEAEGQRRLVLDDARTGSNPSPIVFPPPQLSYANSARVGDNVTGQFILSYSFNRWRLQPSSPPSWAHANPRPALPPSVGAADLKVAVFNVLNYFVGPRFPTARGASSPAEFARQRAKIISALRAINADVLGLVEVQNNGFGSGSAMADLIKGLNDGAAAGDAYASVPYTPEVLGSDAISVKFAYKPSSVQLVGSAKVLDSKVDPEYLDTKSRPAVAQTFRQASSGETFTAVLAHLKSRSSDCADVGDADAGQGAGNCDGTRTRAAGALRRWLASDPTGSGDPDFLLLGDLNAYPLERPIRTFTAPLGPAEYGPAYVNLVARHDPGGGDAAYTYVFKGYSGTLDYALASQSLAAQATGAGVWHLNADEAPVLDYNSEDKSAEQVEAYYSAGPFRSSDHDPVIVGLCLGQSRVCTPAGEPQPLPAAAAPPPPPAEGPSKPLTSFAGVSSRTRWSLAMAAVTLALLAPAAITAGGL